MAGDFGLVGQTQSVTVKGEGRHMVGWVGRTAVVPRKEPVMLLVC